MDIYNQAIDELTRLKDGLQQLALWRNPQIQAYLQCIRNNINEIAKIVDAEHLNEIEYQKMKSQLQQQKLPNKQVRQSEISYSYDFNLLDNLKKLDASKDNTQNVLHSSILEPQHQTLQLLKKQQFQNQNQFSQDSKQQNQKSEQVQAQPISQIDKSKKQGLAFLQQQYVDSRFSEADEDNPFNLEPQEQQIKQNNAPQTQLKQCIQPPVKKQQVEPEQQLQQYQKQQQQQQQQQLQQQQQQQQQQQYQYQQQQPKQANQPQEKKQSKNTPIKKQPKRFAEYQYSIDMQTRKDIVEAERRYGLQVLHQPIYSDNGIQELCPICLEDHFVDSEFQDLVAVSLKCDHHYHWNCLLPCIKENYLKCPVCSKIYGVLKGDQPDGTMEVKTIRQNCSGFKCESLEITYNFPNGVRNGIKYSGTVRVAYLPNNGQGQYVLGLLKRAFTQKLTFTVGTSVTTGKQNTVVWNGIHHKTSMAGGPTNYGYPDPTYIDRVVDELKQKGII